MKTDMKLMNDIREMVSSTIGETDPEVVENYTLTFANIAEAYAREYHKQKVSEWTDERLRIVSIGRFFRKNSVYDARKNTFTTGAKWLRDELLKSYFKQAIQNVEEAHKRFNKPEQKNLL